MIGVITLVIEDGLRFKAVDEAGTMRWLTDWISLIWGAT